MVFIYRLREVIRVRESPHRTASAFSTGVFIGISPLLGLHTMLGVIAAWIFRLNTFTILAGVYITNLWTFIPIYTFSIWVGAKCLGIKQIIPRIDWSNITVSYLVDSLKHLFMPFICGTFIVGSVAAIISYVFIYRATKKQATF